MIPILLLWTSTIGLRLTPTYAYAYVSLALLINLVTLLRPDRRVINRFRWEQVWQQSSVKALVWLGGIFCLTWLTRFIAVNGFLVSPGVDSYHHTLISTLIAEQGQIPTSYEPYAPPSTFTYHFGFHAVTAMMFWLTNIPLPKLTLWVGQGLNTLVVPMIYFSTKRLTGRTPPALVAAFLVGLVAIFPAYMVNWSRFTQLSGLVVLTLTMGLVIDWRPIYWRVMPFLAGAIFLFHYRVFAMFGLLVGMSLLIYLATEGRPLLLTPTKLIRRNWIVPVMLGGLGTLILTIPWVGGRLFVSLLIEFGSKIATDAGEGDRLQAYFDLNRLGSAPAYFSNYWMLLFSLVGVGAGLVKHHRVTLTMCAWMLMMLFISNPYWLPLPGVGVLDLVSVVISLYGPVCFLAALGVAHLLSKLNHSDAPSQAFNWSWRITLIGFAAFAIVQMAEVPSSEDIFVRVTDMEAMAWIRDHTSPEAKFLVNPLIFPWQPAGAGSIIGNDAGYWIPLLAGRETSSLPMILPVEKIDPNFLMARTQLSQIAMDPRPEALGILHEEHITHIFVGDKGGPIPVTLLENTPCVNEVWREGQTRIFAFNKYCVE